MRYFTNSYKLLRYFVLSYEDKSSSDNPRTPTFVPNSGVLATPEFSQFLSQKSLTHKFSEKQTPCDSILDISKNVHFRFLGTFIRNKKMLTARQCGVYSEKNGWLHKKNAFRPNPSATIATKIQLSSRNPATAYLCGVPTDAFSNTRPYYGKATKWKQLRNTFNAVNYV